MAESPNRVGTRAEIEVAAACVRAGMEVFVPLLSGHGRVDLVVVRNGSLLRVQCKSATLRDNAVVFRCCSNTRNEPKAYVGEIDAFGVYSPQLDTVYLVPIQEVPARGCHLRVVPPRNGQRRGIRWASDYEVGPRRIDGAATAEEGR